MGRSVSPPEERSSSSQESAIGWFLLGVEAFLLFCGDSDSLPMELSSSFPC
jgi:hypothetical protein